MAKGKNKNNNKNKNKNKNNNKNKNKNNKGKIQKTNTNMNNKKTNIQQKKNNSQRVNHTESKKFKLQIMDIITIIFTAIIIGLMIFVVYNQFADNNGNGDNISSGATAAADEGSSNATASPTATPAPTLNDIGNVYGNVTNDASVAINKDREYFIANDEEDNKHIYANVNGSKKDLIQTNASSLSVVTDYLSYTDQKDVSSYYVFYINGDGNICYVKDEPVGNGLTEITNAKEQLFLEGNYTSINVSGEYVYHLDTAGKIGRTSIEKKETTSLSSKNEYSDFVLYYGVIYAKCIDDNKIYTISLNDSKKAENLIVSTPCNKFVLDNNWIYVTTDEGISRYSINGVDSKETVLSKTKIDAINVYADSIFYIRKDKLYTCSAISILSGEDPVEICNTTSTTINVSSDSIYLTEEDSKLYKVSFDKENKKYNDPVVMN